MSDSHAGVVRANSAAFSRRDVDAMLGFYARDAVVTDRRAVGWGEFRGHDALRSYYLGIFDNAEDLEEQLTIVSEDGDVIVAACRTTVRLLGQPDAPPLSFDYALRIVFEGELIASMDIHEDADAAAAA